MASDLADPETVTNALRELAQSSLVRREPVAPARWDMVETIRAAALERLSPSDRSAARERHARAVLDLVERAGRRPSSRRGGSWSW
jgi:hypothetical protein